jgi:molybdopterin/thiamine biosynthesis adenylyltransferase
VTALTDAQVERYSRQIILPEVGARGQARLLASRVVVAGAGAAAVTAVTLLGRAGVGVLDVSVDLPALPEPSPDCRLGRGPAPVETADVVMDLSGDPAALGRRAQAAGRPFVVGTLRGARVTVGTLVGRPCVACLPPREVAVAADPGPLAGPAALALGALAATEVLRLLLLADARGRVTTVALDTGACDAIEPACTAGCPLCGRLA